MVHKMTWSCSDSQTFFMKSNVKWLVKRPLIFSKRFRDMSDEEEGRDMTYRRRQRRRSKAPLRYRDEPSDEEEKQCHREVEERGTRSSRGRWGHLGRLEKIFFLEQKIFLRVENFIFQSRRIFFPKQIFFLSRKFRTIIICKSEQMRKSLLIKYFNIFVQTTEEAKTRYTRR